jgi:ribosomal protein L7/L12
MDMLTQDQVTRDVVKRLTETTTVMNINGYDIPEEVVDLVKQGRPINAIKELRTKYDLDLYSAKQITDKILEKIG